MGDTALMGAAWDGETARIEFLLEVGANAAAFEGHVPAVRALLRGGADVAIEDKDGVTVLMWARAKGHMAVVQELERVSEVRSEHR